MDSTINMCVFRENGVICSTYDRCEKCGFNPIVEQKRIKRFREWYAKKLAKEAAQDGVDGT